MTLNQKTNFSKQHMTAQLPPMSTLKGTETVDWLDTRFVSACVFKSGLMVHLKFSLVTLSVSGFGSNQSSDARWVNLVAMVTFLCRNPV